MEANFSVGHLSIERLMKEWRWLCGAPVTLVARNVLGDLFLRDELGSVSKLDVSLGRLVKVAESVEEFVTLAGTQEKRREWFAEVTEKEFRARGLVPGEEECIAFKTPVIFRESAETPNNVYLGNLYEYVSFLGDIHNQIANLPDGTKIRLRIKE
jgi:hypothetical protein